MGGAKAERGQIEARKRRGRDQGPGRYKEEMLLQEERQGKGRDLPHQKLRGARCGEDTGVTAGCPALENSLERGGGEVGA